ncbi:MAG: YicC family protein [Acidobacteria bacterium]|nr:MAG: YicC family protein [Acidobacteriota bacterium]
MPRKRRCGRRRRPRSPTSEAASRDRSRPLQGRPDPDPGRSDFPARLGVGGAGLPGPRQPDGRPDHSRDRAPALDRAARGSNPRARPRTARRIGHPRRALDSKRPLPQAARHAVLRGKRGGRGGAPVTIRSMTGFGRAKGSLGEEWTAEVIARSVNHRFLDVTVKVRENEIDLEPVLRRVFSRHVARGKVEVALRLKRSTPAPTVIAIDEGLLEALLARFALLAEHYPVSGRLEARDLLTIPQIFSVETSGNGFTPDDLAALEAIAREAALALVAMRETEGALVSADLTERIEFLEKRLHRLSLRRGEIAGKALETLRERLRPLLSEPGLDPGRLEQEAALAVDRSDVAEELQRLEGHLEQFASLLSSSDEPVGKKLDFLAQEILRELNTLGSKGRDLQMIREVLEMKSETEKIREQVQNLE